MNARELIGEDLYEALRTDLQGAFPDNEASVDDATLDAVVGELLEHWSIEDLRAALGVVSSGEARAQRAARGLQKPTTGGPRIRYYHAAATHERLDHPLHRFTGQLVAVRFDLPLTGDGEIVETDLGQCLPDDRKFHSVAHARQLLSRTETFHSGAIVLPERIEAFTAPRTAHGRFAAVSAYLCYAKAGDPLPAYYVLEAGLATGQPKALYVSTGRTHAILKPVGYSPTPFSGPDWYKGYLVIDDSGQVTELRVDVKRSTSGPPAESVPAHVQVRVKYTERRSDELAYQPFELLLDAAARIARIARYRRPGSSGFGIFEPFVVLFSGALTWEKAPVPGPGAQPTAHVSHALATGAELAQLEARAKELAAKAPQPGDDAWNELREIEERAPRVLDHAVASLHGEPPEGAAHGLVTGVAMNWAHQRIEPAPTRRDTASDRESVLAAVKDAVGAKEKLRATGRCYSDNTALGTPGRMLDMRDYTLDDLQRVRFYPMDQRAPAARNKTLVEIAAGARVHDVNVFLSQHGLALPITGAFSGQTLIGAMQTSTHGSAPRLPPLCDLVRSMEIVVAQGKGSEVWRVERQGDPISDPARVRGVAANEANWLDALLVSFGSAAVVTSVVIEPRRAFRLQQDQYSQVWSWVKAYLGTAQPGSRHPLVNDRVFGFALLLNPYSGAKHGEQECVISELYELGSLVPADIMQNKISGGVPEIASSLAPAMMELCIQNKAEIADRLRSYAIQPPANGQWRKGWNDSWILLAGPNELPAGISFEYSFPMETYVGALDAILVRLRELYTKDKCIVGPISVRFIAPSRALLGLSHGGPRATIEVLAAVGAGGRPLFAGGDALAELEKVAFDPKHQGRPHWGQRWPADVKAILGRYDSAAQWREVRKAIDPTKTFLSNKAFE